MTEREALERIRDRANRGLGLLHGYGVLEDIVRWCDEVLDDQSEEGE